MSNGFATYGEAPARHLTGNDEHTGKIRVRQHWSSKASWIELQYQDDIADFDVTLGLGLDHDEPSAVELVVNLLDAIGEEDMAKQLRDNRSELAERQIVRQQAEAAASAAKKQADAALLAATIDQRAAHEAELERVEAAYFEATGERMHYGRSLSWPSAQAVDDWGTPIR